MPGNRVHLRAPGDLAVDALPRDRPVLRHFSSPAVPGPAACHQVLHQDARPAPAAPRAPAERRRLGGSRPGVRAVVRTPAHHRLRLLALHPGVGGDPEHRALRLADRRSLHRIAEPRRRHPRRAELHRPDRAAMEPRRLRRGARPARSHPAGLTRSITYQGSTDMTSSTAAHGWTAPDASLPGELPIAPAPYLEVRCHRRLRGRYTGAGALLRSVVPELLAVDGELVAARAIEVVTMAPELAAMVPLPPQTLTNLASRAERTRFYSVTRTLRLSHGAGELVMDWARLVHPGGVVIAFTDLDDADPTDREFVSVLLRRCDPNLVTVLAAAGSADDPLGQALARYARPVTRPPHAQPDPPAGTDLAQLFIDSDGTCDDPAIAAAYAGLPAHERASRHTARAEIGR